MENEQILPCPFCGEPASGLVIVTELGESKEPFYVECNRCHCRAGKAAVYDDAIENWNRRVYYEQYRE